MYYLTVVEREATQTARMTKYTGTEAGDESGLNKSPKMSDSGNSGREGPELSVVDFLSSLAKIPLVTSAWRQENKDDHWVLFLRRSYSGINISGQVSCLSLLFKPLLSHYNRGLRAI